MADVNQFHVAGGMGFIIRELIDAGLVHEDVSTVFGKDLNAYAIEAKLCADGNVVHESALNKSGNHKVLAGWRKPFQPDGGFVFYAKIWGQLL